MKILITGGAGFIGTHLAERFCPACKVVILDNLRRNSLIEAPELKRYLNVEIRRADILDKRSVSRALKGVDLVIHLAAIAGVSDYYKIPARTLRVNIAGTMNLLDCCRGSKVKRFIYFSTSEVYGNDACNVKEDAGHRIGPISDYRWTYAVSKLAGERLVFHYGMEYGFSTFIIRPFNIYGPRQTGEGAISNFIRAVITGRPITIYGDGKAIRSWCYISDCVDAVEKIVNNKKLAGGVFNIGNAKASCTTLQLARSVLRAAGSKAPLIFKKIKRSEIPKRIPDISRASKILKYGPRVGLLQGIKLTYDYYKGRQNQ